MKRHLLKKEWETNIQDYKNSGLSKAAWCHKQNITVSDYKYNFSFPPSSNTTQNSNTS